MSVTPYTVTAYRVTVFDCPGCKRRHDLEPVRDLVGELWTCVFCGVRLRIQSSWVGGFSCADEGKIER